MILSQANLPLFLPNRELHEKTDTTLKSECKYEATTSGQLAKLSIKIGNGETARSSLTFSVYERIMETINLCISVF